MLDPAGPLPPSPLPEWELMSIAAMMVKRPDGDIYIAERIGALALAGDAAGVATWKAVAVRVQGIRDGAPN